MVILYDFTQADSRLKKGLYTRDLHRERVELALETVKELFVSYL